MHTAEWVLAGTLLLLAAGAPSPPRGGASPPRSNAAPAGEGAPRPGAASRAEADGSLAAPPPSFSRLIERKAPPDELIAALHALVEGPDTPDRERALELL